MLNLCSSESSEGSELCGDEWPRVNSDLHRRLKLSHRYAKSIPQSNNYQTYILYLEPTEKSALHQALKFARELLVILYGPDSSSLFPLHCSMTSFFTVASLSGLKRYEGAISSTIYSCIENTLQDVSNDAFSPFDVQISTEQPTCLIVDDGRSVIMPLSAPFWTRNNLDSESRLTRLCEDLENSLSSLSSDLAVFSTHTRHRAVAPKNMRHMSLRNVSALLPHERRQVIALLEIILQQVHRQITEWNVVVYEVHGWGWQNSRHGEVSKHCLSELFRFSGDKGALGNLDT